MARCLRETPHKTNCRNGSVPELQDNYGSRRRWNDTVVRTRGANLEQLVMNSSQQSISAVVLDWAGTMIDFGSLAPTKVFQEVFAKNGLQISPEQAREPMGMAKKQHIAAILENNDVREKWRARNGQNPTDADVEKLYKQFLPMQKSVIADHCDLIPGAISTYQWLIQNDIRVASTTGYTREIMDLVTARAKEAGYRPEVVLCAEDAPAGRPAPWLIFECAKRLNVYPTSRIVKVDDTIVGVQAGKNAGAWSVGVARSGNLVGLGETELNGLETRRADAMVEDAGKKLICAGAHFVIDSVAELPQVIERINELLAERHATQPTPVVRVGGQA